jgi:hypothetical protein
MTATHDLSRGLIDADAACEMPAALTRRDVLKGSGAMIVGFSLAGPTAPGAAADGTAGGPPDPRFIDSWIAVQADNTATVFLGKCELGQGAKLGCCRSPARSSIST